MTPDELIFTYTDADAIRDGVLVDLTKLRILHNGTLVNRMTRHLFEEMRPFIIVTHHGGTTEDVDIWACDECWREFIIKLAQMIRTKLVHARDTAAPGEPKDYLYELPGGGDDKIWLIRNEVDGWTIMFASDY